MIIKFSTIGRIAIPFIAIVLQGCAGETNSDTRVLQTQPSPAPDATTTASHVEVTLGGPISAIKGAVWPELVNMPIKLDVALVIKNPSELLIHFPGGRTVQMRTHTPFLIGRLNIRDNVSDLVMNIEATPDGTNGMLVDKVHEAQRLLKEWRAVPDDRMRRALDDLVTTDYDHPVITNVLTGETCRLNSSSNEWSPPPMLPVGNAALGDRTTLVFRFYSCGVGNWSLLPKFALADWETIVEQNWKKMGYK